MTLKPCRLLGHEIIINKIKKEKYSNPANEEFCAEMAAILDFDPFCVE